MAKKNYTKYFMTAYKHNNHFFVWMLREREKQDSDNNHM